MKERRGSRDQRREREREGGKRDKEREERKLLSAIDPDAMVVDVTAKVNE